MKYLLLFLVTQCFAQKQYTFDYIIEYKTTNFNQKLNKNWTMYLLTNSKDDSYHASISEKDSLNFHLVFNDYYNYSTSVIISKKDFANGEFINIDCHDVNILHDKNIIYNDFEKHYKISKPKDTIFENKKCFTYIIDAINPKRKKRKKIGHQQYIVDNQTAFHVPISLNFVLYRNVKSTIKTPNGIYLKKIFYNYLNEPTSIQERVNYLPTNKKIVISTGCE